MSCSTSLPSSQPLLDSQYRQKTKKALHSSTNKPLNDTAQQHKSSGQRRGGTTPTTTTITTITTTATQTFQVVHSAHRASSLRNSIVNVGHSQGHRYSYVTCPICTERLLVRMNGSFVYKWLSTHFATHHHEWMHIIVNLR